MKQATLLMLKVYQRFFTLFSYGSCRYYPTCSEYARWQILNNGFLKACFFTFFRVLRCNKLFSGGIDYPVVNRNFDSSCIFLPSTNLIDIKFWFIPKNKKSFYVIQTFTKGTS